MYSWSYYFTTYNRRDLLAKAIQSLPPSSEYHVISTDTPNEIPLARAWNTAIRLGLKDHNYVIICNDDIEFIGDTGQELTSQLKRLWPQRIAMTTAYNIDIPESRFKAGMFCFCVGRGFTDKFGWFDEGFRKCTWEDMDMIKRVLLADHTICTVAPVHHVEYASTGRDVEQEDYYVENYVRYCLKWGGAFDNERYTQPWNGKPEQKVIEEYIGNPDLPKWDEIFNNA